MTPAEHLNSVENLMDKGEYKAASIELKNALKQNPDHGQARHMMGTLHLELEDGFSAEKELNRAMELGVDHKLLIPPLARALMLQNNYQGVLDLDVDQADDWEPKAKANFMASRGLALLALERQDEALQAINDAYSAGPASPYVLLVKARLKMAGNEIAEARTVLNKLFEIKDNYGPAWSFLGDIERIEGNLDAAEAAYGKAIEYKQVANSDLLNRSMVRIDLKKLEEAEEDIDRLTKLARNNPGIDYAKGLIHFHRKEYVDAQRAFESVLRFNDDYMPAVLYAGISHFMQGNQEIAERHLDNYVARIPDYLPANRILALIKLRNNEFKAAERLISNAVEDDDMDVFTITLLANALLGQNKIPEGMAYLQKAAVIQPESAALKSELGLSLLRQGDKEAGVAELEAANELDPELRQVAVQLVVLYLSNKEFDKALETALAHRDNTGDASAYLLLGSVYMARKETDNAVAAFQHALELDPGNTSASNGLAAIAILSKQLEKAKAYYSSALEKHPGHLQTLLGLAKVEAAQGNTDAMKSTLQSAIEHNPESLQPRLALGQIHLKAGYPEKTLDLLSGMKNTYQNNLRFLVVLAEAEGKTRDWAEANASLSRIVELVPNNPAAHFQFAMAKAELGDMKGYRNELQKTLEIAPDYTSARIRLAALMLKEGQKDDAEKHIQILKEQTENNSDVHILEGKLAEAFGNAEQARGSYMESFEQAKNNINLLRASNSNWKMGDRSEAVKMLEDWLKEYPDDNLVRLDLANRYIALDRNAEAIASYREIIKSSPKNIVALNNLSWLLQDTKPEEALQFANQASTLAPQSTELKDTLAMALLSTGDAAQAQRVIDKVLDKRPDNLTYRYHKALILNKQGKSKQASVELKAIIDRNVEFPEKKEAEALYSSIRGQ